MEHSYQHRFDFFKQEISSWHRAHKSTSPGTTTKIKKKFEKYEYDYHAAIAEYRKTGSKKSLNDALKIVDTAEKQYILYKKLELLGTLTK